MGIICHSRWKFVPLATRKKSKITRSLRSLEIFWIFYLWLKGTHFHHSWHYDAHSWRISILHSFFRREWYIFIQKVVINITSWINQFSLISYVSMDYYYFWNYSLQLRSSFKVTRFGYSFFESIDEKYFWLFLTIYIWSLWNLMNCQFWNAHMYWNE